MIRNLSGEIKKEEKKKQSGTMLREDKKKIYIKGETSDMCLYDFRISGIDSILVGISGVIFRLSISLNNVPLITGR